MAGRKFRSTWRLDRARSDLRSVRARGVAPFRCETEDLQDAAHGNVHGLPEKEVVGTTAACLLDCLHDLAQPQGLKNETSKESIQCTLAPSPIRDHKSLHGFILCIVLPPPKGTNGQESRE